MNEDDRQPAPGDEPAQPVPAAGPGQLPPAQGPAQTPPAAGVAQPAAAPAQPAGQILTAEVLPSTPWTGSDASWPGGPAGARRGRSRWGRGVAVAAVALAVTGVIGGAALAWSILSGGGDQPEQHLPASSLIMIKVDLDPGASQKIAAIRFAHRFAGFADDLDEKQDMRRWIYEKLAQDEPKAPAWSQIEPWLGERAGLALLPAPTPGEPPVPVVALQVTDEDAARAVLQRQTGDLGAVVADGWALLAQTGEGARSAAAAAAGNPLSEDPTFAADMNALGEDGIATAWLNIGALAREAAAAGPATSLQNLQNLQNLNVTGHGAAALRFSGKDLEVAGVFRGLEIPKVTAGTGVESLPSQALVAVGASGADQAIKARWNQTMDALRSTGGGAQVDAALAGLQQQYGLQFPDDLYALFGRRIALMVAGPGDTGVPAFGVRATSDAPRLAQVLDVLTEVLAEQGVPATVRRTDDGWVLGTTAPLTDALARDGDLGRTPGFRAAVPDPEQASFVAYADCAGLADAFRAQLDPDAARVMRALDVIGVTARYGSGEARLTVRVASR